MAWWGPGDGTGASAMMWGGGWLREPGEEEEGAGEEETGGLGGAGTSVSPARACGGSSLISPACRRTDGHGAGCTPAQPGRLTQQVPRNRGQCPSCRVGGQGADLAK